MANRTTLLVVVLLSCWMMALPRFATGQPELTYIDSQVWDQDTRFRFWFTPQGTQLIPYDWFLNLEQSESRQLFRDWKHLEGFRYISLPARENGSLSERHCSEHRSKRRCLNEDGLPIGFTYDPKTGWLGLNCAACHTNVITYEGTNYLVDGAPTLANFQDFFINLVDALWATNKDPKKFERFATGVLGKGSDKQKSRLRNEMKALAERWEDRRYVNSTSFQPSEKADGYPARGCDGEYGADYPGFGRLDALAGIMNQVSAIYLGDRDNANCADGPVSYPFLWGTPQSDWVQWNGSVRNDVFYGPLGRNVGQVVGVLGRVEVKPRRWWHFWRWGLKSKVRMRDLGHLEHPLWHLRAPSWRETSLPALSEDLVKKGAELYLDRCLKCHRLPPQADAYKAKLVRVAKVGTDSNMAHNVVENESRTLRLEGTRKRYFGKRFQPVDKSSALVDHVTLGALVRRPVDAIMGMHHGKKAAHQREEPQTRREFKRAMRADEEFSLYSSVDDVDKTKYKARPLYGIWATAPYLHNGSVPNLKQLLTKPDKRVRLFCVGNREFDPSRVGFRIDELASQCTMFDTTLPGNSSSGHNFGVNLPSDDKEALIEYLKSL